MDYSPYSSSICMQLPATTDAIIDIIWFIQANQNMTSIMWLEDNQANVITNIINRPVWWLFSVLSVRWPYKNIWLGILRNTWFVFFQQKNGFQALSYFLLYSEDVSRLNKSVLKHKHLRIAMNSYYFLLCFLTFSRLCQRLQTWILGPRCLFKSRPNLHFQGSLNTFPLYLLPIL